MEKVDEVIDKHRSGILCLKKIAESLQREGESWQANVIALHKARAEEKKALAKVEQKEQAIRKKQKEREAAKAGILHTIPCKTL